MAKKQSFGDRLLSINGVKEFIFVRNDGHIIGHNMASYERISSMVAFSGVSCEGIKSVIGNNYFKYFSLTRSNKENFFIFPVDKYYLGILVSADVYTPEVIKDVSRLTRMILAHKNKSAI